MSDPKTPVAEDSQPDVGRLPFSRSLRGKLILTLGLSIALTAAVLSVADYRYVRAMLRESTEQQLTLRAEGLREVLLAYVAQQRERVSLVASSTQLRQLIAGWAAGQISQDELVEATSRILRDVRDSTSSFHNIRIADKTGVVITASEASLIGANVADLAVFAAALEGPTLGVPEAVDHGFDSILGAPARSADGEVLGVVLVTLDAEPMHRILGQMPSRFRTARVRIGAPEGNNIRYLFQGGETAHRVVSPAADPGMARALAGESGFDAMIDSTGHELLVAYRTVGYGGWGLVAEVDVDEAYAPIFDLSVVILMTALVVGLLGLVGSVRVAGNISRPLLRLARVAERVGGGDHGIRARVHGQDEVAVVARSFNLMTEQVEQHRLHLQEQVAERTRALRERTTQLEAANTELGALVRMLESQAETIDRDLKRAEVIQRSLLPQIPPSLLNYSVQTLYRPGHNIGGDLYDAVCIGDRYLVLVVVDASGHGVSAAMLAVLFKLRLRVADEVTGLPLAPAVALSEMNARLVKDIKAPGVFFTCVYAVLDVETGELVLASAGHPPAICLRESGDYELLEHTGPALGLDHEATFTERRIHLAAADRVLMYTDGVFDVGGDSPPDAPSIARTLHEMTVDVRLLERLLTSVSSGLDRDDRDDVTLLLLDARSGQSSFLLSEVTQTVEADRLDETPEVAWAEDATLRYFRLSGRVTWTFGEALLASAVDAIDAGRNLAVDLSRCIYLDSTMLGTLHEIVEAAIAAQVNVLLSGVPAPVVASIGELSMTDVLAQVTDESLVAPGELHLLDIGETDLSAQRNRLIRAHEVLMSLSTENEEEFRNVVETLRADETGEEGRGASTRS